MNRNGMAARKLLDADLLEAVGAGEASALAVVYEEFGGMVYGVALRLTSSPMEAEDVLQDVFLALPESIATLRMPSAFGGWLKRLTVRATLDRERGTRRRRRAESSLAELVEHLIPRDQPIERMALEQAIGGLSAKLRVVFVLHAVEGFRHAEIAEMLGITANASMQRIHRARALLRRRLADGLET